MFQWQYMLWYYYFILLYYYYYLNYYMDILCDMWMCTMWDWETRCVLENTSAKCVAIQVSQWTSMNILQICLKRFLEFHEGDCDIESEREEWKSKYEWYSHCLVFHSEKNLKKWKWELIKSYHQYILDYMKCQRRDKNLLLAYSQVIHKIRLKFFLISITNSIHIMQINVM